MRKCQAEAEGTTIEIYAGIFGGLALHVREICIEYAIGRCMWQLTVN